MARGSRTGWAIGALLAIAACKREARPRYEITDEGSGDPAADSLIPLRPGYLAMAPDVEGDPAFAMVTRTTQVDGGDGVVLQMGLAGENLPNWDVVLDETKDGVVARVAGGQILDPPWLILPSEPRDGMTWQVVDKDKNVLANGSVTRGEPIAWPITQDPLAPPITDEVRPWILTFDVAHAAEGTAEQISGGHLTIEEWEAPIRRPASRAPVAPQPHFRDFNPLSAGGGALEWALVEGEGFVAETALIPSETIATPVLDRQPIEEISAEFVDASGDFTYFSEFDTSHPWNVTVNRADPRAPADVGSQVHIWAPTLVAFGEQNSQLGWDVRHECRGLDVPTGAWDLLEHSAQWFQYRCLDATHFEVGADGVASAPTWLGYTPFEAQDLFFRPGEAIGIRLDLIGAFHGVYLAQDGSVRGVARELQRTQITHVAELIPNDQRDERTTDEDFPAVGNTFQFNRVIDDYADPVGEPVLGDVLRTIALRPEGPDGVPLIVDSWPFLGHAELKPAPEGSPAAAYLPDFAVDALIADPITVVYEGDGRRQVTVALSHGGVHELDVDAGALRWRSLGRPELPDRTVVVGAWREGDEVALVTREGIVATGLYEGIPAFTDARLRFFRMPVQEGEWEPIPSHLFPGVDDLPRRPYGSGPEVAGTGVDRVVCAPDGVDLDVDSVAFDGWETIAVPTDDRCALALRSGFSRDPASIDATSEEPATLRFHRADLGDVVVRGRGSLTPIGGRHLVPRDRWETLANPGLPVAPGLHYESLAAPHPTNDVFPGSPGLLDDPSGDGTWAISFGTLADCADFLEPMEPCFELRYVPEDGGVVQSYEVATSFAEIDPDDPMAPWQHSRASYFPAADVGLYVSDLQYEENRGFAVTWLGPDGAVDVGPVCAAEGATSPDGPRPPFLLGGEPPWGPVVSCATAEGLPAQGAGFNDQLTNLALPPPGDVTVGFGSRDPWRGGLHRLVALDPDAAAFLERHGGPEQDDVAVRGGDDWERRRKLFLRAGETATPWLLYETDAFQRPGLLLAAGVGPPLPDGADLDAFELPFLPHDRAIPAAPDCDPETEVALPSGDCTCAFEHEDVNGVCTPIFGGSFAPAPSCAAIEEARGVAPEFAFIDVDGPFEPDEIQNGFGPHRMRCRDDGLTELAPDPLNGVAPALFDTPLVGAFELTWTVVDPASEAWVALYEAPIVGLTRSPWASRPIAALEGDRPTEVQLAQRHRLRVRSEVVDFGEMLPGAYRWTRDEAGMLRFFRDDVLMASLPLDVSPLYLGLSRSSAGQGPSGLNVAFAGPLCTPDGRTYTGVDGCVLEPQTCDDRGHECGNGDDGAFGRIECGEPDPGVECEFARNRCIPDTFEPNDGPGYPLSGQIGRGVANGEWTAVLPDLTVHDPADVDAYLFQGGDRARNRAAEFVVTVEGVPGVTYTLTAGVAVNTTMGFSAGDCPTSCVLGTATTMDPHVGPTYRPPGCVVEGEGPLTARIRMMCPFSVTDADWGDYLVTVTSDDPDRNECVPYDLTATLDVATTFP
jgi:hypothetical protein